MYSRLQEEEGKSKQTDNFEHPSYAKPFFIISIHYKFKMRTNPLAWVYFSNHRPFWAGFAFARSSSRAWMLRVTSFGSANVYGTKHRSCQGGGVCRE
jgi:hypothetical protein